VATSKCRYCFAPILWVQKPSGAWHPPFNALEELENLDYEVAWSPATGDWTASPVDQEITAKLTAHDCPVRTAQLIAQQEANQAFQDAAEPLDRLERAPLERAPRIELPVRTLYRNPEPEQYVKVALRLRRRCPTCGAMPFEWCSYLGGDKQGQFTQQLHTSRKAEQ